MNLSVRFPVLPVLISYVAGVIGASVLKVFPTSWMIGGAMLALSWMFWMLRWRRATSLAVLSLAIFVGGYRWTDARTYPVLPGSSPRGVDPSVQTYEGIVTSYPTIGLGGSTATVQLNAWRSPDGWKELPNSVRIFISGEKIPVQGDRIRFRANLRSSRNYGNANEWDVESYSRTREIDFRGTVGGSYDWEVLEHEASWLQRGLNRIRRSALDRADVFMDPANSALFASLVLGDQGGVGRDVIRAFRNAGILHLLVVSGSHVALVAWLGSVLGAWLFRRSLFLCRRFPIWHARSIFAAFAAIAFCLLTDIPVPTARALIGVLLGIFLFTVGRRSDGFAALLASAFGILLWQPLYLFDVSAQLTFSAVFGILIAIRYEPKEKKKHPNLLAQGGRALRTLCIVSLGAYFATLPIVAYHFHQMTLWSLLPNLIFVPFLGGICTAVGLVATFLSGPFTAIGNFLLCFLDELFRYLIPGVRFFASLPGSDVWTPVPSLWVLVGYAGLAWTFLTPIQSRPIRSALVLVSLVCLSCPYVQKWRTERSGTEVTFLSVGEGDSAVLHSRDGSTIIVDGGTGGARSIDIGDRVVVPWLRAKGYRRIDLLILSHADQDHIGGAWTIMNEADVKEVWYAGPPVKPGIRELFSLAQKKEIEWRNVSDSSLGLKIGDFALQVLHPPRVFDDPVENNHSLVMKAEAEGKKFLFTGDLQGAGEAFLLKGGKDLRSDVLKIGHHGSKTSSTRPFLDAVHPTEAVVSVGFVNRFHHPSPEVLKSLKDRRVQVLRTDQNGQVGFRLKNREFEVFTGRSCLGSV